MVLRKPVIHLLSGGLDSTILLYDLINQGCDVHCVVFDYGQAHARREIPIAKWFCSITGVKFTVVTLPTIAGSTLTDGTGSKVVPNRNAILLSFAVSIAARAKAESVTFACNADDAADFPDCRPEFVKAINGAAKAAGTGVEVCAPYVNLTKRQIVGIGKRFGVPMSETWSCYLGGVKPCGGCGACQKRMEAMS